MKRGDRIVHGDKELIEKLGRNDPCPCGSGRRFQGVLPDPSAVSSTATTTGDSRADPGLRIADPSGAGMLEVVGLDTATPAVIADVVRQ